MAMDPVGKEDKDVDNDGKVTKADKYLMARRRAIAKRMKEEVEQIDEISASTLRNYIDKSRADKKAAMKDRTAAEKNIRTYGGMAMDKKERDDAARRVGNRNQGISVANKKLGTYPADKAKAKVMAREEIEINEAQSMSTALKNALAKPEPGSKLDRAIKAHNNAVRYGADNAHPAILSKAPHGHHIDKKGMIRLGEEVEQIDEISTELKKRYVEKGAEDVVDRFTGRGKHERPRNPAHFTKTGRVKKSALNRPEAIKYREKLDNRRDIVNKVSQEVHGKKRFGEEVELDEALKYANVNLKDVKATLDAHRATGEIARHLGGGKIAYTGKSLTKPNNQ